MQFGKKTCTNCGMSYDEMSKSCPYCNKEDPDNSRWEKFDRVLWMSPARELALFLIGFLGFYLISFVISFIVVYYVSSTGGDVNGIATSERINMALNVATYALTFAILGVTLYKYRKDIFKSFSHKDVYLKGLGWCGVLIAFSLVYSLLISLVWETEGNTNQVSIEGLTAVYPWSSLLLFGIVAPLVEEATYRVGLFTFCKRINRWAAYLITAIVFSLIHFDFSCFTSGDTEFIINELINLPSYIVAALVFSYAYEKSGYACSSFAHMLNNIISVVIIIIEVYLF
ncbi:MAG: CPBP family intramembrane metalloprotease [Coprobacillus sp.]|nr:CPBP family intramembrane metalloprotease [Coprobacillus sp.]